jgi:orotidine-5'-phosphate decarboxylase
MKERIIIALDVNSRREALGLIEPLKELTGMVKVGLQLYTAEGPTLVREIVELGVNVFLDLKFHDIPNTVRNAAVEAAKLGVSMMTIHTAGGRAMMESVSKSLQDKFGSKKPIVVGITVLTSLDDTALQDIGVGSATNDQVLRMARLADSSGLDGVVCSPREIRMIRGVARSGFKIVTPGIRMPGQSADDQERTATPKEAIGAGADYIVVGRSVTNAPDPRAAMQELIQSL